MYEVFEHTADLGLRVTAPSLPELFAEAGEGLCATIVDDPETVMLQTEVTISLPGQEPDYLLFDFLSELLYRFESERLLLRDCTVRIDEQGLEARCRGEVADESRHRLTHEVKAVTYHQLRVAQTSDGWEAEVIVDI